MQTQAVAASEPRRNLAGPIAGTLVFALIFVLALNWAKWTPYSHKLTTIWHTRTWPSHDLLAKAGSPGSSPSLDGAWAFTKAYALAVWPAVVAGLLVAAGVEALVPRRWLLGVMACRSRARGSLAGGLLAMPSLMCTCCTAPVAATLRRNGASTSATVAYWLGNPVLNPAVLAFLALVGPWQWVATRVLMGIVLVFGVSVLVARFGDRGARRPDAAPEPPPGYSLASSPRRFAQALARVSVTLLPEYAIVVFLLGLFRGWAFPLDGSAAHWSVLAVAGAAVLGTLVVVPTGGEIPILLGLALAGVSAGVLGALLIALPAVSIVSMAMVVRDLSPRTTLATAGGVMVTALAAGGLLALLT